MTYSSRIYWKKIKEVFEISSLGKDIIERIRVFSYLLYIAILKRFGKRKEHLIIQIKSHKRIFPLRADNFGDLMLIHEIFVRKPYQMELSVTPVVILDIGANIGVTSAYFASVYPLSIVHSIEPNPMLKEIRLENTKSFSNIRLWDFAIGLKEENKDMYINKERSVASSLLARPESEQVKVKVLSPTSMLKELDIGTIDLLKFDIEGSEVDLFTNEIIANTKNFVGELHEDLLSIPMSEFLDRFKDTHDFVLEPLKKRQRYIIKGTRKS